MAASGQPLETGQPDTSGSFAPVVIQPSHIHQTVRDRCAAYETESLLSLVISVKNDYRESMQKRQSPNWTGEGKVGRHNCWESLCNAVNRDAVEKFRQARHTGTSNGAPPLPRVCSILQNPGKTAVLPVLPTTAPLVKCRFWANYDVIPPPGFSYCKIRAWLQSRQSHDFSRFFLTSRSVTLC